MQFPKRIVRRVGEDPHKDGAQTVAAQGCPDVLETDTGDFAVIGIRATNELRPVLPESAGCGPDEEIVIVPRATFLSAGRDLPQS